MAAAGYQTGQRYLRDPAEAKHEKLQSYLMPGSWGPRDRKLELPELLELLDQVVSDAAAAVW